MMTIFLATKLSKKSSKFYVIRVVYANTVTYIYDFHTCITPYILCTHSVTSGIQVYHYTVVKNNVFTCV